jgi:guanylate kinase
MLEASEQRQREELARRFTQFNRDIEMRRSADMMRINQDFGQRLVQSVNLMRRVSVQAIQ